MNVSFWFEPQSWALPLKISVWRVVEAGEVETRCEVHLGPFGVLVCGESRALRRLPEMIVCRDAQQAARLKHVGLHPDIRVVWPSRAALVSAPCAKITVLPGVDLQQDVDGQGSLESLLRSRQLTWGDRASFVVL